jgi:D-3-phosphoglycerate dehydrogenase
MKGKFKVLVGSRSFGKVSSEPIRILEEAGCEVVVNSNPYPIPEEELITLIPNYDALITGVDKVTERVVNSATHLRVISKHGAGYDNIDLKAAKKRGITVVYAPGGEHETSVADMTVALILACARQIPTMDRSMKQGEWKRFTSTEMRGKVLGIIGMGRIGESVVERLAGFKMRIIAYDIKQNELLSKKYNVEYTKLEQLLKISDFVSIHLPLNKNTTNMISVNELNLMKPSSYLINTARGGIVDEDALYEMLRDNRIAGAAIDVFKNEPPEDEKLQLLANVIATPHVSGYTVEALHRIDMETVKNTIRALNGEDVINTLVKGRNQ